MKKTKKAAKTIKKMKVLGLTKRVILVMGSVRDIEAIRKLETGTHHIHANKKRARPQE